MKENDISNQGSLFFEEKPQKISLQESSNHLCKSLPDGLRHVVVYADINNSFPPIPNSHLDIDLLRAANQALKRNTKLNSDVFLFIINDSKKRVKVNAMINSYGFPNTEVIYLDSTSIHGELVSTFDMQELQEEIGYCVENWLSKYHPGAIAFSGGMYLMDNFWWVGIEHCDYVFEWPFEASKFGSLLPYTHRDKTETWLTVLGHALTLDAEAMECEMLGQQRAAVYAATLCEWLHGFEAAAGNSYNDFDPDSAISSLGLSSFFLGFEAARLSNVNLDEFFDDYECNDNPSPAALKLITEDLRSKLSCALSSYFGCDFDLLWTLYSAIWPNFNLPMEETFDDLLSLKLIEFSELEAPWLFVSEGWCESAYPA